MAVYFAEINKYEKILMTCSLNLEETGFTMERSYLEFYFILGQYEHFINLFCLHFGIIYIIFTINDHKQKERLPQV